MEHTAVRTWNRPHTKATVTVTCADGSEHKVGGNRAERCSYAIVYQRADESWSVIGLRSEPKGESGYRGRQDIVPITDAADLHMSPADLIGEHRGTGYDTDGEG